MPSLLSWKKSDLGCHILKAKNTMYFFKEAELNLIKKTIFKPCLKILHDTTVQIRKVCKISASRRLWNGINCFLNAKNKQQWNFNLVVNWSDISRTVKITICLQVHMHTDKVDTFNRIHILCIFKKLYLPFIPP